MALEALSGGAEAPGPAPGPRDPRPRTPPRGGAPGALPPYVRQFVSARRVRAVHVEEPLAVLSSVVPVGHRAPYRSEGGKLVPTRDAPRGVGTKRSPRPAR